MKRFLLLLTAFLAIASSMTVTAQDFAEGLYRVKSKRTSYYLSTATKGKATTTPKALSKLDQVWILQPSGSGYTFRSANTGEYLQADYDVPSSTVTTLYIGTSSAATSSDKLFNISSESNLSGYSMLNTNANGYGLHEWVYDAGSDWYIEAVENFTLAEVKERILGMSPYASEPKDGGYYRLISYYDLYLTEGTQLSAKTLDEANLSQVWQLHKSGAGWSIENVVTQKYIARQTTPSTPYAMGASAVAFNFNRVADDWDYRWTIRYGTDWGGLHDAASQGHSVVYWSVGALASEWHIQEADVTQEEIEAARGGLTEFENLVAKKASYQTKLNALFEDKACTTLKAEIQALSDEELAANANFQALNADMQQMVLKVKNNTWQQFTNKSTGYTAGYEKFFRVADYGIYSNDEEMANSSNFTMSNAFGRLSGPTGIVANPGDIIYIYVSGNAKNNSELLLEAVGTDGVAGNHATGEQTKLTSGLNLFRFSEQKMLYVLHRVKAGVANTYRHLSRYSDITVHIEGGQLNGYWDATRNMTNADWKLLQQDLLKAPYINLKTKHLVFQIDRDLLLQAEPNEVEGMTHIWEQIVANEDRYMGVEDFAEDLNNIWNVFSGASSYMHSTTRGTWYSEGTIATVMNYNKLSNGGGHLWGPSHEIGHNHQGSINVIGTTESSNNLFSNINTFETGILNSRRFYPFYPYGNSPEGKVAQDYMANQTPWLQRNIWYTTSMFFQLYLYFHVQGHDTNFYPNLFRQMRKSPINKWSGPGNGGPTSYGKDDYLHLAKMICDVAQADLSEFFEAYGMFIPVDMMEVGDYSTYHVTTTQADIDEAKAYMQKYEKKLGNLMFIDDRIIKKKADADNIFGCVVPSDGYKRANDEYPYLMASASATYVGGDYESFTTDAAPCTDDYYTLSSDQKTITFNGSNWAGHKFYDKDGNLLWATNKTTVELPSAVLTLGLDNVTVVTANYDMTDMPCTTEQHIIVGDLDGDDMVSIADVTKLVNIILKKETAPTKNGKNLADVNGDGEVTIADVTELVNLILKK